MIDRALLLTPSRGLGGGIERFVETLEWAFVEKGVEYRRVDLQHAGMTAHARMIAEARDQMLAFAPARLIVAHQSLLPVARILTRRSPGCGISILCYGTDVWGTRRWVRQRIEHRLMRGFDVRIVAISGFTAGTLVRSCQATLLRPGLCREWFDTLVKASADAPAKGATTRLVTAFRLEDWRGKGLPELLTAIAALARTDVQVTVCGTGEPSPGLEQLVHQYPFCTLRPGCTDQQLADELAQADLFVLATRTRVGRSPSGEGFGLVLLEAQIAGTPVIAPAYGGSHDAYLDRITGFSPIDESAEEMAKILEQILNNPDRLAAMGRRAAEWARECFDPDHYASQAVARLL